MAANDELPRGWVLTAPTDTSVIVPASPGISHVLTGVTALLFNYTPAHGAFSADVELIGPSASQIIIPQLLLPGLQTLELDRESWSGSIVCLVGALLDVTINQPLGANTLVLIAEGYDI